MGRSTAAYPPVPVALSTDQAQALEATAQEFGGYGALPLYANMFPSAGFPAGSDNRTSPDAINSLAVSGTSDQVRARLEAIVAEGIGEVLVSHVLANDAAAERAELMRVLAG